MDFNVKHLVSDMRFLSNHIGCHDSRIDNHDGDLKELTGTVDIIKEEVHNLVQMNQCSHCQDYPGEASQPMEDISVTQPVGFPGKPK